MAPIPLNKEAVAGRRNDFAAGREAWLKCASHGHQSILDARPNWLFGRSGIVEGHSTNLARKRATNSGGDLKTVAARKILAREVVK